MKAHKQQHNSGTKGNRNFPKEDYTGRHRKSDVSTKDDRTNKVQIVLTHSSRGTLKKSVESYRLESEIKKWNKDGWFISVIN